MGREIDPTRADQRRLLSAHKRLSYPSFGPIWGELIHAELFAEVLTGWVAEEELRELHTHARTGHSPQAACDRPHVITPGH